MVTSLVDTGGHLLASPAATDVERGRAEPEQDRPGKAVVLLTDMPFTRRGTPRSTSLQQRHVPLGDRRRYRQPPFEEILEAARGRAPWALARLYESLAPAVAGYLRSQGVREAEDVVSDVFVAVLCRCSSFRGDETQFRRWVFTIAHHRMVDARRSNGRTPTVGSLDADSAAEMEPGGSPAAEDDALRDLGNERVGRLLAALSSDQRCVLALRIIADLSVEDVAIALDKPPGAVKALQHRALATLRRTLSQEGGDGEARA
ncbi:MAG TPA: sigma-70 family RNA polymerase sigma factor [Acidimicrobiales bacterium]|nr:sigma-70 family RNA polymerase sigma factor [Acidimicrobiales bacterium]